jgi:hypothetical protein
MTAVDLMHELAEVSRKYLWVREVGNNGGEMVTKFQTAINADTGHAWCAAFVCFCIKEVESKFGVKSPLVLSEHVKTFWNQNPKRRSSVPIEGGVVVWVKKGTTLGHCGIVVDTGRKDECFVTIEGNTNGNEPSAVVREGQGVFLKTRHNQDMGDFKLLGFLKPF